MKAKNIKEFKSLIERYETITIDEIETEMGKTHRICDAKNALTGYGLISSCTLCKKVHRKNMAYPDCDKCVYGGFVNCTDDKTYYRIQSAKIPRTLLRAYRARAKYMRSLLEETK